MWNIGEINKRETVKIRERFRNARRGRQGKATQATPCQSLLRWMVSQRPPRRSAAADALRSTWFSLNRNHRKMVPAEPLRQQGRGRLQAPVRQGLEASIGATGRSLQMVPAPKGPICRKALRGKGSRPEPISEP